MTFVQNPDYMLSEIWEQPTIVKQATTTRFDEIKLAFAAIDMERVEKVVLTGSGDSYCAGLAASYVFGETLGVSTSNIAPMELSHYRKDLLDDKSLLLAISVSGKTPRILEAAELAKSQGAQVIGVTDNSESPLAEISNSVCMIGASPQEEIHQTSYKSELASQYDGYQHDVAQTKTYTANLISLLVGSISLSHEKTNSKLKDLKLLSNSIERILKDFSSFEKLGNAIAKADRFIFASSGPNYANALFGSYKMYEFALIGIASDIEEYCHTSYFITEKRTPVVFLAPSGPSYERAREIIPVLQDTLEANPILISNEQKDEFRLGKNYLRIHHEGKEIYSTLPIAVAVGILSYQIARKRGNLDTNTFRGGLETEKYVGGSLRTIRQSKIWKKNVDKEN